MKKFFLIHAFIFLALAACESSPKKTIERHTDSVPSQEVNTTETNFSSINQKTMQTFENIMNEELSSEKTKAFMKYIQRQRGFYFIAQDLMNTFDQELDKLVQLKEQKQSLSVEDQVAFNKIKFSVYIAWQFHKRNIDELEDLYQLTLTNAHDKGSKHQLAAKFILRKMPEWMNEGWKQGHKLSTITLAHHLEHINDEFLKEVPNARVVSFDQFTKISARDLARLDLDSKAKKNLMSSKKVEGFIQKEWDEYFKSENNAQVFNEFLNGQLESRSPQALDDLLPAADGRGNITGNKFPQGTWALTFDDGPHPKFTQGMFDALSQNGVSGTFFWLTKNIKIYPDLVKRAGNYRFNRASHSYTHAQLTKLSEAQLNYEVKEAFLDFTKVVGAPPTLFRCPYGACGGNGSLIRQKIAQMNMLHVLWNVDTLDWQDSNAQSIFARTQKQISVLGRGIVLFHDIHPQSVEATKLLIPWMKNVKQYQIKPLPEIIGEVREKPYASP